MIKNNNRNSRDDKSKTGDKGKSRRPTSTDQPKSRTGKSENDYSSSEKKDEKRRSSFGSNDKREFQSRDSRDSGSRPYSPKASTGKSFGAKGKPSDKPWEKKEGGKGAGYGSKPYKEGSSREEGADKKRSYVKKDNYTPAGEKPKFADRKGAPRSADSRPYRKRENAEFKRPDRGERVAPVTRARKIQEPKDDGLIRLNRYIANAGICSRRKADELIESGVISVNGVPVQELGHKVDPYKDEVRYNGELLKREKKIYVLLNKPKDYITTTDDPQERKTVMQLVDKASRERIYPVGRLDRNTTGLLLMTNDGELADKLSHPKNGITKIYHVELNKNLSQGDFNKIQFGLELEDGLIKPDNISYVAGASKKEIGIQIHSGKNRIVRRIFEHLGYDVVKLDRVVYGNLTKKDLPRGKWRFLEEHELIQIKHLIK